jgi:polar amino acid transport system substrate-binding protein
MRLRKAILRVLPLLLLSLSMSATADVLDEMLERGSIRFGVAVFVPWTMKSDSGELIGFEVDLAKKIADDMGLKAEFKLYPWADVIPALQSGEIDILMGGMSITPGRALQVNFTRPTAESGVSIATNIELTKDIKRLDELNDPKIQIAVVNQTLAHSVTQTFFGKATITVYPSGAEAGKAVVNGDAHAYLASLTQTRFLAMNNGDKIDLPISEPLMASHEAIAVKKGEQELLNFLNSWVTARRADRWIEATRDYWFETLEWTEDVAK